MKKIIISLGIIICLCLLVLPVKAAGVTATTSSARGSVGDEVTVTVTLSGQVNVISGGLEIEYDKSVLELKSGSFNLPGATLTNWDNSKKLGAFMFMSGSNISGTIFTAKFKILESTNVSSTTIKAILKLTDPSNNSIDVNNVSGTVTIECKHDFTRQNTNSDYLAAPANCSQGVTYYYSCTKCGEKGKTTFSLGEGIGHKFDKKVESSKYQATLGSCTEAPEYYYACSRCGEKGKDIYKGSTIPGHTYGTTYKSDEKNHWYECTCGDKKSVGTHTPGAAATETKPQTCTACGYVIQKALGHTHKYGSTYKSDEKNHWYECTCGDKDKATQHTFEWIVDKKATEKETGIKHEECMECGFERNKGTIIEKVDHVHSPKEIAAVESTHLEKGNNKYYQCSSCGKYYKDDKCTIETTIEAEKLPTTIDHEYGDWQVVKEATFEEAGLEERTCECGHKESMKVSPLIKPVDAQTNTTLIIVCVTEGVVILGLAIVLIVMLSKKKRIV